MAMVNASDANFYLVNATFSDSKVNLTLSKFFL